MKLRGFEPRLFPREIASEQRAYVFVRRYPVLCVLVICLRVLRDVTVLGTDLERRGRCPRVGRARSVGGRCRGEPAPCWTNCAAEQPFRLIHARAPTLI